MLLVVVLLLALMGSVTAQFPYLGECPSLPVQKDFDMKKFEGMWYEIERTMSFLEIGSKCVTANFSDSGYEDGSYEMVNEGKSALLNLKKSTRLIAKVPDKKEPAKMELRLSDQMPGGTDEIRQKVGLSAVSLHGKYWILATDYDNYAIIWSCNHIWLTFGHARTENLWVLSRERSLNEDNQKKVKELLKGMKVKVKHLLKRVVQKGCD